MNDYKLLALDIDGTLLNSRGELPARVRSAVAAVRETGMLVTLATGRTLQTARPIAQALSIRTPLVVNNGGLIISPVTDQVLLHRPLQRSVAVDAVELLRTISMPIYANRFALEEADLFYEKAQRGQSHVGPMPDRAEAISDMAAWVAQNEPLKVMSLGPTAAIAAAGERLRRELMGRASILVMPEGEGCSLLEVAPPHVNKATGLERLAALNGISPQEILAFGDNLNDCEMLRFVGTGVAMGNASDAVKAIADQVAATNDEAGVAQFLERYLLTSQPNGAIAI